MSDCVSTRRELLAAGGVAAVASAGCLGVFGDDDGDRRALRLTLSRQDGPLRDRYVVDLDDTRSERDEEAFRATLDGSTYTTQHRKPFFSTPEDPEYTEHDGTYYRLGSVVVDEATETRPVLRLHDAGRAADEPSPDAVAAERLPEGDRRAVHIAHMAARARGNEGGVPWGLVQRGGYVYRRDEAVGTSRLLGDDGPDRVVYRGTEYAVETSRERFHEPVYRATVEPVATDPDRMETILRASFVDARVASDALSAAARDVIRAARGDGHRETHPYSEGYRDVLKALHERAFLDGNVEKDAFSDGTHEHGTGLVLYDGEYFDYRLRFRPGTES
jgi:hypothetical protein